MKFELEEVHEKARNYLISVFGADLGVRRQALAAAEDSVDRFIEIYEDAGRDFYEIPIELHSPAVVHLNNLTTGNTFSAGSINYDVLEASFFSR